ncbi:hypothetical protein [Candidatus Uabimicrobium sp. HlEnr_7]|uniref:hypothetical protein n=1 Tax=Candidatus Uabimicrobium helgolandensis TaxID=3095367 RepID=UPI0035592829
MTTQTMIIIGAVVAVLLIALILLMVWGPRAFREAKYDFMRFALLLNNCCLLAALVHLVYLHKDYYAFGYLAPILASYSLFFSKKFKNLDK